MKKKRARVARIQAPHSDGSGNLETFYMSDVKLRLDITRAKSICGFPFARADSRLEVAQAWDAGVMVNPRRAARANLRHPVIIGTIGGALFLIDGNHRSYRARWLKRKTLPCYVLTEEETASCMLHWRYLIRDKEQYRIVRDMLYALPPPLRVIVAKAGAV